MYRLPGVCFRTGDRRRGPDNCMYNIYEYGLMLADGRGALHAEALRRVVKPGSVAVDLGAGPSVLAAYACRLGAGRVASFSYPFGDHGRETRGIVDRAGYRYACGGRIDVVRAGADRLLLPRLHAPDVGGPGFERWIGRWL